MSTVKDLIREELSKEFSEVCNKWENSEHYNSMIYDMFKVRSLEIKELANHINIVRETSSGYGEDAFRYLWLHLVNQMPDTFSFLEIGIYKGSVLSLVELIASIFKMNKTIYGVSPLDSSGDKYSNYLDQDYFAAINKLYFDLQLDISDTKIIKGYSTDPLIKDEIINLELFDMIYIDGSHDYEDVVSDIELAHKCLKRQGLLILDDASSRINLGPSPEFHGHEDVARAIDDILINNNQYQHLIALGHNRVFKKL